MQENIPYFCSIGPQDVSRKRGLLLIFRLLVVSFHPTRNQTFAFIQHDIHRPKKLFVSKSFALREQDRCQNTICTTPETNELYVELQGEIECIARELWGGEEIPRLTSSVSNSFNNNNTMTDPSKGVSVLFEGEAPLPETVPFSERGGYFRGQALKGCPKAQHSYGLLLWSGFAGVEQDPEESAKFHAAAACQHHLDGMAVFGGCLRTGTGIPKPNKKKKKGMIRKSKKVELGLRLINFCASAGNPTGVNKQAALLESNGDDFRAVELYEACLRSGRVNALLLFNLGWCLLNGRGVDQKDEVRGISLWKEATEKAPDEGSEEAAWNLYLEYIRDDPKKAQRWLELAEELGYSD